jgi:hypothetical protein
MNIEQDGKRKKKIKASIENVDKIRRKTLNKIGGEVDDQFVVEVGAFIEKYRSALIRLAKR